jgi:hypothetical protein
LPGTCEYKPGLAWITKRRADNSLASDFVCFVDDQRVTGMGSDRIKEAGHAISTREAYLGLQDALQKVRHSGGTTTPGAWAGVNVCVERNEGVVVMSSQDKWDRMKGICAHWLDKVSGGQNQLDFKRLRSDRGFMVYVTQAYPGMKPYLKGFHLSLETWRGNRCADGWKEGGENMEDEAEATPQDMEEMKHHLVVVEGQGGRADKSNGGPSSGITFAVPRFKEDLEALMVLTRDKQPVMRPVRSRRTLTAYYGFGDASGAGFGATVERPNGIHGRYGLWGRDAENKSSNYRELRNLVETVEEETQAGYLDHGELWIFTDNSTAESCFFRGGSSSRLLHELVLRLRRAEMNYGFTLHVVHVAGTRMIEQGTDGLSRGALLEGVMAGRDMLSFVDLALTAIQRHRPLLEFVKSWWDHGADQLCVLGTDQWFREGHGVEGGQKDKQGIWIPNHARNGQCYLWSPPPVIADVALEECLKAVHKRTDAFHIFLIPRPWVYLHRLGKISYFRPL